MSGAQGNGVTSIKHHQATVFHTCGADDAEALTALVKETKDCDGATAVSSCAAKSETPRGMLCKANVG